METLTAFERGLKAKENWKVPQLNPFVPGTDNWLAWELAYTSTARPGITYSEYKDKRNE